ncbi:MAG TPA: hypothetical protein VGG63_08260 [Steroidobacteraceae bacterium]|jgi:cytochrome o ubiquinol oxidase subunit 2
MYNGSGFSQEKFTAVAMTPGQFAAWVRKIRASGVPMDTATLNAISKRTTRAQLIAAVSTSASSDGNVYVRGVTPGLFAAVVAATRNGTAVAPAAVGDEDAAAVSTARKPAQPAAEKLP